MSCPIKALILSLLSVSISPVHTDVELWFSTGNNGPKLWIVS